MAIEAGKDFRSNREDAGHRVRYLRRLTGIANLDQTHLDFLSMIMRLDRDHLPVHFAYDLRFDEFKGYRRISLSDGYAAVARFVAARDEAWALCRLDARGSSRGTRMAPVEVARVERLLPRHGDTEIARKVAPDRDLDSTRKQIARHRRARR
jgi:hypothetical protein